MPKKLTAEEQQTLDGIEAIHDARKLEYAKLRKQYVALMDEIQQAWVGIEALHNTAHEIKGTTPDGSCAFGGSTRTPPGRSDTRSVVLEVLDAAADDESNKKLNSTQVYERCIARGWDSKNASTPKGAIRQMLRRMADDGEIERVKTSKGSMVYWSEA